MPTTYKINVPNSDDVSLDVTDTLEITFTDARRFCSPDTAATYFSPALPNGPQAKDYISGRASPNQREKARPSSIMLSATTCNVIRTSSARRLTPSRSTVASKSHQRLTRLRKAPQRLPRAAQVVIGRCLCHPSSR